MPLRPLATPLLLVAPTVAVAAPLPLVSGTYVLNGTPCADAPFAAMRSWDGIGLGDPHSHDCRIRRVVRTGERYRIDNDCIGVGVGAGPRSVERLTLRIGALNRASHASAFTILSGGRTFSYRICPAPVTTHAR